MAPSRRCRYSPSTSSSRRSREESGEEDGVMARFSSVSCHWCQPVVPTVVGRGRGGPGNEQMKGERGQKAVVIHPSAVLLPKVSITFGQPPAKGLDSALDQPGGGGRGPAEVPGDVGQRPAFQVAQADRLALVVGERGQGLGQALRILPPHDLLTG